MTLLTFILISMPISILAIILWIFNDYRKYKKQNNLVILLILLFPTTLSAQYVDDKCQVSFKWHENQIGKLEYNKDKIEYEFIPNSTNWKIKIRNNSLEDIWINWTNVQLIINGRATEINCTSLDAEGSTIKSNFQIDQIISISPLQEHKKNTKFYDKKYIKKGNKTAITFILPIAIGSKPQFFNRFDFIIAHVN